MADQQIGNSVGVAGRSGKGLNGGDDAQAGLVLTNAGGRTIAQLRARLTAISGTTYTAARLNTMSYNDMVYAVRQADHPGTI